MADSPTSSVDGSIPRLLYGTAWKKTDTASLVQTAIGLGFRGIDTACQPKHYDERGVGEAVAACLRDDGAASHRLTRAELYLQTKFTPLSGHDPTRIPYDPAAPLPEQVSESCGASLRNLQTNYVDGLLLHSPLPSAAQTLQVWQAMEALVDAGAVRRLGISNCYRLESLRALCDSARIKPTLLQNRFYADTGYDREIRAFCREQHIVYQSFWTLTANPDALAHRTVIALASRHCRSAAQILFRYLTQVGVVPLTGTRSQVHMREDLSIFDFELSGFELEAMEALF
jgi:diketogulonate reductase-like aldo/keto reductase